MPLFMDIHTVDSEDFSAEDVVKAHMKDLSVQDRFGVRQIKYWVNVQAKTLFCLMEGPDREACNEVHVQSHGQTACNIIEVNDDEFQLFLGEGSRDNTDLAQTLSGEMDTGYRTLMLVQLLDLAGTGNQIGTELISCVNSNCGNVIPFPGDLMASFVHASDALNCSYGVRKIFEQYENRCEYRMALFTGRPVDEVGRELFESTKKRLDHLCMIGNINKTYVDADTLQLSKKENMLSEHNSKYLIILSKTAFNFLEDLFRVIENKQNQTGFKSHDLHSAMGISKSQLYRKLKAITDRSPNQLIQEIKLRNAAQKLNSGAFSVSEVAYDAGFNSPAYFTRAFKSRFGMLPSDYTKLFDRLKS